MIKGIFKQTQIPIMEKVLDIAGLRQKTIASNVANVLTPGYQRKEVDFAGSLKKAMNGGAQESASKAAHSRHIRLGNQGSDINASAVVRQGGTPDLEEEMARSAENQLLYSAAAKIIANRFKSLRGCIRGRF